MQLIKKGFVLAAGLGTRMRHLTENCPKPLLTVNGKTMLDYALDSLVRAGVEEAVVNTFYFAEQVEAQLAKRSDIKITVSREDELLETGGGVKKAIEFFGNEPFYVLNSDVIWLDGEKDSLTEMADKWDSDKMDLMLLLHHVKTAQFHDDVADYYMEEKFDKPVMTKYGRSDKEPNYIVAGPRIVHPRLFDGFHAGKKSFLELFIKAEDKGTLYGLHHEGEWFHIGTPEALEEANKIFARKSRCISY